MRQALGILRHMRGRRLFARIKLAVETEQHAAEDRRKQQIGIGVGAGDAMLDAGCRAVHVRDANRRAAMAIAPGEINRRKRARLEAAIGIGEGRKDQLRLAHRFQHARGDRLQQLRLAALGVQNISAILVDDARMHMQAGTGMLRIGLGHAGRFQAMPLRCLLGHALQIDAVVCGCQRIRP
ncbi:conserved hypothetical protein, partial [Ricinus communis]